MKPISMIVNLLLVIVGSVLMGRIRLLVIVMLGLRVSFARHKLTNAKVIHVNMEDIARI